LRSGFPAVSPGQIMILPPAMSMVMPVIHDDCSEARNSVAAMSWG
jgi:hypothetical protein